MIQQFEGLSTLRFNYVSAEMRYSVVCVSVTVMVLVFTSEVQGFEHLKHKFKLKKLAKLAFAAKLLVPHLIPLPIPLPIIKRNKHKHSYKVSVPA